MDHLTSKRFIVVFAMLLLLLYYGVSTGMDYYHQQVDQHNNPLTGDGSPLVQAIASALQGQIQDAKAQGASAETIRGLNDSLLAAITPPMPSVISVFQDTLIMFTFLGMVLGALMGFDVISGEMDTGSIKSLVTCPISRDAIINGKALGAVATLALALGVAFLLSIALVMYLGAVPGPGDLMLIFAFYMAVLLYCTLFFGIATMMSVFTRSTSMSTIGTVCVLVISILLPLILVPFIGPTATPVMGNVMNPSTGQVNISAWYDVRYHQYSIGELMSEDAQTLNIIASVLSPQNDFGGLMGLGGTGIGHAILSNIPSHGVLRAGFGQSWAPRMSILESLASVWVEILVLIVYLIATFVISYLAFMRMDIR